MHWRQRVNYLLDVSPAAQAEIRRLPGHIRQRVRRAIQSLVDDPRPSRSKELNFTLSDAEPRRLRIERWRIVYAVIETDYGRVVAVVAVRKRPPYDYRDLTDLFADV
jgi:mRNA interferase RelE/StbE